MIATKKLFPYQAFQGDEKLGFDDDQLSSSSEDDDQALNNLFCMATDNDEREISSRQQQEAEASVQSKIKQLDANAVDVLPYHIKWVVRAFAAVAVENSLEFHRATHYDKILDEFKDIDNARSGGVHRLTKYWKAGTYGEVHK